MNTNETLPKIAEDITALIGGTPMLRVRNLDTGPCTLLLKLECQNPGNSIKDRIAVSMINRAEEEGRLQPGGTIYEGTAGNTGIALALVGVSRGYKVKVVMPDKMSAGKISHLKALGAEVVLTRSDVGRGHPQYYQDLARALAQEDPNGFFINQFENAANPTAHLETTGPEIWAQTEGNIDCFVAGIGSGGTVSGCGNYLREKNPDIELVLADPVGSILAPLINEGKSIEAGSWLVEGVGEDFVPDIAEISLLNEAITVDDKESFLAARELLRAEGIMGGSSTGLLVAAALRWCRAQTEPKTCVTFVCDLGAKYMDRLFNDVWMRDQGLLEKHAFGDLRDLIGCNHTEGEDHVFQPDEPLAQVHRTMRLHDISQAVILDGQNPVGIVDESDVLRAVVADQEAWERPVCEVMSTNLETIPPEASTDDLLPIFAQDRVAIVASSNQYFGLITRIDLLNFLRQNQ